MAKRPTLYPKKDPPKNAYGEFALSRGASIAAQNRAERVECIATAMALAELDGQPGVTRFNAEEWRQGTTRKVFRRRMDVGIDAWFYKYYPHIDLYSPIEEETDSPRFEGKEGELSQGYLPEFCELVIFLMGERGLSAEAVCGMMRISANTFMAWASIFPDFQEAVQIGEMARLGSYERLAKAQAMRAGPAAGPIISAMLKNLSKTSLSSYTDKGSDGSATGGDATQYIPMELLTVPVGVFVGEDNRLYPEPDEDVDVLDGEKGVTILDGDSPVPDNLVEVNRR